MRKLGNKRQMVFVSEGPAPLLDGNEQLTGHEPIERGREAPAPTRTTSHPHMETEQRKPYLPTEDTSTPALGDGVSFRQRV